MLRHCLGYAGVMAVTLFIGAPVTTGTFVSLVVFFCSHYVLDSLKGELKRRRADYKKKEWCYFLADQALHAVIVLVLAQAFFPYGPDGGALGGWFLRAFDGRAFYVSAVMVFVLLCGKPAGIFVKTVLQTVGTDWMSQEEPEEGHAGYIIGILERELLLFLSLAGEFGAVGFVLAAKSVARFERLRDKKFAEKYLVGTLMSALIAIGSGLLLRLSI